MTIWPWGRQTPDTNLMRFIARRFPNPATMLDIGSGEGSNARELRARGHKVWTIDKDPSVDADEVADIIDLEIDELTKFDVIYDINTLCHVENPPLEKIRGWLKPGGYFFSICPTERTWPGVADGKDYTRFAKHSDLEDMFHGFSYEIYETFCPDFRGNYLESWIVEAKIKE